jgi:hypothetical protein
MMTVTIEKVEAGYKILPSDHVAKDLQETERFVRTNFQVIPDEWAKMKSDLDRTGKASIERSLGKFSQGA